MEKLESDDGILGFYWAFDDAEITEPEPELIGVGARENRSQTCPEHIFGVLKRWSWNQGGGNADPA